MPGIEARAPERTDTSSGRSGSPKRAPIDALDPGERGERLALHRRRGAPLARRTTRADLGRDREAGRHRDAEARHLGEVRALAAEQLLHVAAAVGLAGAEEVDALPRAASLRRAAPARGFAASGRRALSPVPLRAVETCAEVRLRRGRSRFALRLAAAPSSRPSSRSRRYAASASTAMRSCCIVSRSRTVTLPSVSDSKS